MRHFRFPTPFFPSSISHFASRIPFHLLRACIQTRSLERASPNARHPTVEQV